MRAAPERRVDNLITRTHDAAAMLRMHAVVLEEARAALIQCRRQYAASAGALLAVAPAAAYTMLHGPMSDLALVPLSSVSVAAGSAGLFLGLAALAALRGRAAFLALHAQLASAAGLRALSVGAATWRAEPALAAACPLAGWLPVLRTRLGPGEVFDPAPGRAPSGPLCVLAGQDGMVAGARVLDVAMPAPEVAERRAIWLRHIEDPSLAAELGTTVRLGGADLAAVAGAAKLLALRRGERLGLAHVAAARQRLGADRLSQLAHPVRRTVGHASLVLAPELRAELDALVARCCRREALWEGLGATMAAARSPGVRALFTGESGTGKTLAASYLASALGAPLYRCDIAAVMNKYVGETEKNLGALLEEAEARDVVLLFDEADALFGRRGDGKETGERYANMLTNFLLTRIEAHGGIVVLTTNSRLRLDNAFMRRLDMVLTFPAASYAERLALWRSHLGGRAPGEEALRLLAGWCDLSGGSIRNVVLAGAAEVEDAAPIGLAALLPGLEREYRKLGRSLPAEIAAAAGARQEVGA